MKVELRYIVVNDKGEIFGRHGKPILFEDKSEALLTAAIFSDSDELDIMQLILTQSDQLEETIKKSFPNVTLKVRTEELKNEGIEIAKRLNRNDIKFEVVEEEK